MEWRLHLSSQAISAVHLIPGNPPQVAVWDSQRHVHFYHRHNGDPAGKLACSDQTPPDDLADPAWREFVDGLRAPNQSFLPTAYLHGLTVHASRDGRVRLYHFRDGRLELEVDGRHIALDREQDGVFLAADLDRGLGLVGAINDGGALHIFQQHVRVGAFDLGLSLDLEARLSLVVPDATGSMAVSDGERVRITDSAGRVRHEFRAHFAVGALAVSPNGQLVALADIDDNVIRVYDDALRPTHQKHAIDLVAGAQQVQLLASMPGRRAAVAALDVSDDEALAFAMGGVVCVTRVEALDALPQPRPLL